MIGFEGLLISEAEQYKKEYWINVYKTFEGNIHYGNPWEIKLKAMDVAIGVYTLLYRIHVRLK